MLEPTIRELMEEAGIRDIAVEEDERGIVGKGVFRGTEEQLRHRLGDKFDLTVAEWMDKPMRVRCRPKS